MLERMGEGQDVVMKEHIVGNVRGGGGGDKINKKIYLKRIINIIKINKKKKKKKIKILKCILF